MPEVEFESTIPMFERAKPIHALDRAAIVIDNRRSTVPLNRSRPFPSNFH
jgi:hypothetical protein